MAPSVSVLTETGFHSIVSLPHPHPLVLSVNKSPADVTLYFHKRAQGIGTQRQCSENRELKNHDEVHDDDVC